MSIVSELKNEVLAGNQISKEDVLKLIDAPLDELCEAANEIRDKISGSGFDICTIINGKCGKCSEDCKYCSQSAHYHTPLEESYPLLDTERLLKEAKYNADRGVIRYSIVTSGKRLSKSEVCKLADSIKEIKSKVNIEICVSLGLLDEEDFKLLYEAGARRVHCNLESSERYFKEVCTTHTYLEKIETLKAAKRAGMSICSGGIMGLGENFEDRIDMVLTARELGVKSIPVNFLNPIPGTPYENNVPVSPDEARRCVAIFRFIIPDGSIRLAGGRGLLGDTGRACFMSGANATISGDMLTTAGITIEKDMKLIDELGYEVRLCNE